MNPALPSGSCSLTGAATMREAPPAILGSVCALTAEAFSRFPSRIQTSALFAQTKPFESISEAKVGWCNGLSTKRFRYFRYGRSDSATILIPLVGIRKNL